MSRSVAIESRWGTARRIQIALGVALVGGLLAIASIAARADVTAPEANDRPITVAITSLMARQHLTKHPFDIEINRRWLNSFLKMLDSRKLFFTQADVDGFNDYVEQLDDMAKKGDTSFAYRVFHKFTDRLDERVKLVEELVVQPQDFTVEEELVTDSDLITYAKTNEELRDRWRKRIKFELLELATEQSEAEAEKSAQARPGQTKRVKLEGKPAQDKITKRYRQLARRMRQTSNDELLEMYLSSLTTSYDPHTSYMSPTTLEDFEINMRLNLEGIGAQLADPEGETLVKKIIPGGAAFKDGRLKPDDHIVGVGQNAEGDIVSIADMKLRDVVKLIRGKQGTTVRLAVIPKGETETKIYNIVRQQVELSDQEARSVILEAGQKPDGTPFKVGVINLPSFYMDMSGAKAGRDDFKSTSRDVSKLLKDFNQKKVDAVVVDLRHNGGGSLTESIKLTGLFIDTGPVVQVKDADGQKTQYDDTDRGVEWSGPLVVLTSKMSASASEIFAGAIQDYKRGIIVGDTATHGKGTVQSLLDLGQRLFGRNNAQQLGALKITEQQFYRPDGDSTQNRGVLADIELPSLTSQLDIGEANLDYALKFDHVDPVAHQRFNLVDNRIVQQLKSQSADRRKDNREFQKLATDIDKFNVQKNKKKISLNKEKFVAEKAELTAEKQEEQVLDEENDPNRPVVKRDYYFDEVLSITADYAKMLKTNPAAAVGKR